MNHKTRCLIRIPFLLAIVTAIFFSVTTASHAATFNVNTQNIAFNRFIYTGTTGTILTGGAYFRDAGEYSNSMLKADGMPRPRGEIGGNIHYVDRNGNNILDWGTDSIVYCLQNRKGTPRGQTYSTESYANASSANLVAKDAWTYNGLVLILQNGFPAKSATEMGMPDNDAAFYATACSIRFWLAKRERDLNLFPWQYNYFDLSRGVGSISVKAGQEAVWNKAVSLYNLAVSNTGQRYSDVTATYIGADTYRPERDWFIYRYQITTSNMTGGYQISSTSLPAGSVITGYTGNSGDVLNVHIPFSASNTAFSFNVTAYDNAQAGSLEFYSPTNSTKQAVTGFNLKTVSNSKTITLSGTTRAVPDLVISSYSANKTTFEAGEVGYLYAAEYNQGTGYAGADSNTTVPNYLGQTQRIGNMAPGQTCWFTYAFTAPTLSYTSSWYVPVYADYSGEVWELNEGNNGAGLTIYFNAAKPDLVPAITTDKTTYQAGETITAYLKTTCNGITGGSNIGTWWSWDRGDTQVDNALSVNAGSSVTRTRTFVAPIFAADTQVRIGFEIDYRNNVAETNESNNTVSYYVTVKAGLPDLTITSMTVDRAANPYEPEETITVAVTVKNRGYTPANNFKLSVTPDKTIAAQEKTITSLAAGASTTLTFTFNAPVSLYAVNYTMTGFVDSGSAIMELSETNNTQTVVAKVNALRPDLSVIADNITTYFTDKDVVIAATVRNLSAQPVPHATVRVVFGSVTLNESIPIPGNGSNLVVFRMRTPVAAGSYAVNLTADPTNQISELDETNNTRNKMAAVSSESRIAMPDPDTAALEQSFLGSGKILPPLLVPTSSAYHTWQEYRLESGSYILKNYWMRLTTIFTASPDPRIAIAGKPDVMESGFGLEAFATTSITTNYDRPDKLVGPQMLYAFYPETFFGQTPFIHYADALETDSGITGDKTSSWRYPISPFSTIGSRLHFTPLWIPDGSYSVLAQAFYAWSPVGQIYEYQSDAVTIEGDMYDRITAVRR